MSVLCKALSGFKISEFAKISLRCSNTLPHKVVEGHRTSLFNEGRVAEELKPQTETSKYYETSFKEFLPNPDNKRRDKLSEMLERKDMLKRLSAVTIPEFYVGSIMAVTVFDKHSPEKKSRFVGICIQRTGIGLRSNFSLRNVIDGQGMEVTYDMFCPVILKIEVLRLEMRLDNELLYLRDAPLEYSTFPFDMLAIQHPPSEPVPINSIKIKLKPRPWQQRWERMNLKGVDNLLISEKMKKNANHPQVTKPWDKYDLMKIYRGRINDVETQEIMEEVFKQVSKINKNKDKSLKFNNKPQK